MRERSENYDFAGGGDADETLVAPRFDDEEARRAHPVVPLAEASEPTHYESPRAQSRRGLRRSWSPVLLAVALLASAAVGGAVATNVLRHTPSNQPAAQAPAAVVAPAQAAEVPAQVEPPPAAPAPRDVADTRPEPRTLRPARDRRADDAQPRARDEGERDDRKDFDGEDRRDKERVRARERRRERRDDEAEAEKEMRKVLKRAKGKAPRLVDVLVNPGN
ncbi:MAG TPA: hypothetical protein VF588_21885 [Pyrinomonadaceae bacterium]|jgi:hypothetical protein